MKKPKLIIVFNNKMYMTGIRKMKGKKDDIKWKNAEDALNTTAPDKKLWDNGAYCMLIPDLPSEADYLKWVQTDYFIKLCWIKKVPMMATNVMLALERGIQLKNIESELGIKLNTANKHLRKMRKLLGVEFTDDARFIITGKRKGENLF